MRRLALFVAAVGVAAVVTCRSPVDPDMGRFSCEAGNDCGSGYECIQQFSGGGKCFKQGECVMEECNGLDDNCEGRVDESFPSESEICQTGQSGPCSVGRNLCVDAGIVCRTNYTPVPETCNGVDDDCQNGVDDSFAFATDNLHCGICNRVCGAGAQCTNSMCVEVNCGDGLDNNDGGGTDCADPACRTELCGMDGGFNCGAFLVPDDAGVTDAGSDAGTDDGGTDAGEMDGGMDAGEPDGGMDAGEPDAGFTPVFACVPRESPCNNGIDDYHDGQLDCLDADCDGKACDGGTCMTRSCR